MFVHVVGPSGGVLPPGPPFGVKHKGAFLVHVLMDLGIHLEPRCPFAAIPDKCSVCFRYGPGWGLGWI